MRRKPRRDSALPRAVPAVATMGTAVVTVGTALPRAVPAVATMGTAVPRAVPAVPRRVSALLSAVPAVPTLSDAQGLRAQRTPTELSRTAGRELLR